MPYVIPAVRPELDKVVDAMVEARIVADGDLNYVLFKYARRIPQTYNSIKNYRAELREAADEIGRRILAPYETGKCVTNGDVL